MKCWTLPAPLALRPGLHAELQLFNAPHASLSLCLLSFQDMLAPILCTFCCFQSVERLFRPFLWLRLHALNADHIDTAGPSPVLMLFGSTASC